MDSGSKGQQDRVALIQALASVITTFAGLGFYFYALGFALVLFQLDRSCLHDFSDALYAASLVPNKVAVGQGMRALFDPSVWILLFGLLLGVGVAFGLERFLRNYLRRTSNLRGRLPSPLRRYVELLRIRLPTSLPLVVALMTVLWALIFATVVIFVNLRKIENPRLADVELVLDNPPEGRGPHLCARGSNPCAVEGELVARDGDYWYVLVSRE